MQNNTSPLIYKVFNFFFLFLFLCHITVAQNWERTFLHDTGYAKGFDVVQTSDGGYVIVGEVDLPTGAIRHYIWLIKTDNEGHQLWSKVFSGGDVANQSGRAITESVNGDLFIAGSNNNLASVLKTNSLGDSIWTKDFGGMGMNRFNDLAQDANGNLVLAGQYEAQPNSGIQEVWAMRMTPDGEVLWSERYFEPNYGSAATDISLLPSDEFLIVGNNGSLGFSLKINGDDGQAQWFNNYQMSVGDYFYSSAVHEAADRFLLGGHFTGFAGHSPLLIATNSEGILQETVDFYPTPFATITAMASTTDQGVILTGSSFDFWEQTLPDMTGFIAKLDAELETEWSLTFTDSLDKQGASIYQDQEGNYIMAGSRQGGMWLKKIMGEPVTTGIVNDYASVTVYPNPTSHTLSIRISETIPTTGLSIHLYDTAGRCVYQDTIRAHVKMIDLSQLASGLYAYTIQYKDQLLSNGKLLLE